MSDWEQFPPIEGNKPDIAGAIVVILSAVFAVGMMIYVLLL